MGVSLLVVCVLCWPKPFQVLKPGKSERTATYSAVYLTDFVLHLSLQLALGISAYSDKCLAAQHSETIQRKEKCFIRGGGKNPKKHCLLFCLQDFYSLVLINYIFSLVD